MDGFEEWEKAHLHLHLEGSVEPETIHELNPDVTGEEIRHYFDYTGFDGFLKAYIWVNKMLRTPEDYALVSRRLFERLEAENTRYAEITLSAGVILWKEQNFSAVYDALLRECARTKVRIRWIPDAVRHFGADAGMRVAKMAVERRDEGVVAFGIGGDEERGPAGWFHNVFAHCRDHGLHLVAHAGETVGAESIWAALAIGAERIGHGIRSIEDPELIAHLRDKGIPLEVCISSNVRTGAVPSLDAHPIRKLYDAGVPIVLDTDDPPLFGTTIEREYEIAAQTFGFTEEELRGIMQNGRRFAFDAGD